jgi:outer membrane protein assembly factor BamB
MTMRTRAIALVIPAMLAVAGLALTPGRAAAQAREWTTSGYDAQRTGWVRADPRISRETIEDGTFQFLWKHTFNNEPRQLHSLSEPVLQDFLVGYRGFKSLAFLAGAADRVFAIDTDLAIPYWQADLTYAAATGGQPPSSWECPGGMLAAPARRTGLTPPLFTGGSSRRGARARSTVGDPGKGAAVLAEMAARSRERSADTPPQPAAPARRIAPVPFGGVDPLYAMGGDGLLRTLRVTDGANMEPPVPFLPPNARPTALLSVDGIVYTSTANGCGAVPNAVWAIDTTSLDKRVVRWETGGPNIAGSGPSLGTDGTLYVALGASREGTAARHASSVVALDRLTLAVKDWFTAEAGFNVSPIVIRHNDRDLVIATANDGRMYLLDGSSLGGGDHKTPLHVTARYTAATAGAGLATWDDGETRWVLAPALGATPADDVFAANGPATGGSIVAFKVIDRDGALALEPVWRSRDLTSPLAPIVVNGIVFAAASGEHRDLASGPSSAEALAQQSTPAHLFALDPATGAELWSSGTTVASFARAGLAAGGGQVYLVTYDNTLYAFGIPLEH